MLIGRIVFTEDKRGIRLYDVDGSSVHLPIRDALELLEWMTKHATEIEQVLHEMQHENQEHEGRGHGR